MIKIKYDCKLGTEDLYIALKNQVSEISSENVSSDKSLYKELKNYSQEELKNFILEMSDDCLCELLLKYFSSKVLADNDFLNNVEIFDITNVKVVRDLKTHLIETSMKAKDVMRVLNITRPTLCAYVKKGLIKIDSEINGQYKYNRESVYKLMEK